MWVDSCVVLSQRAVLAIYILARWTVRRRVVRCRVVITYVVHLLSPLNVDVESSETSEAAYSAVLLALLR